MTLSGTDHPENCPAELIAALEDSSDRELREIIEYAQQLLRDRSSITDAIESRHGEELVRVEDHGAYTIIVVERPDETGEARGPFAYRVRWEPHIDDEGGRYRWHYLGKVYEDAGGDSDD
jgi:hypothetical protein